MPPNSHFDPGWRVLLPRAIERAIRSVIGQRPMMLDLSDYGCRLGITIGYRRGRRAGIRLKTVKARGYADMVDLGIRVGRGLLEQMARTRRLPQ